MTRFGPTALRGPWLQGTWSKDRPTAASASSTRRCSTPSGQARITARVSLVLTGPGLRRRLARRRSSTRHSLTDCRHCVRGPTPTDGSSGLFWGGRGPSTPTVALQGAPAQLRAQHWRPGPGHFMSELQRERVPPQAQPVRPQLGLLRKEDPGSAVARLRRRPCEAGWRLAGTGGRATGLGVSRCASGQAVKHQSQGLP